MNAISLTAFKADESIGKIWLRADDGEVVKEVRATLDRGKFRRKEFPSALELSEYVGQLSPEIALTFGIPRDDFAAGEVVLKRDARRANGHPIIARCSQDIQYSPGAGILFFDIDADHYRAVDPEEARNDLIKFFPVLAGAPMLAVASQSSFIWDTRGNKWASQKRGAHLYVIVARGKDVPQLSKRIIDRLWLLGQMRYVPSAVGTRLTRGLIDITMFQPERFAFAARPECRDGLECRRPDPLLFNADATPLELDDVPMLAGAEAQQLKSVKRDAQEKFDADPEVRELREALRRQIRTRLKASKSAATVSDQALRQAVEHLELTPAWPVTLEDGTETTIAELQKDPEFWNETRMRDPLEPDYRDDSRVAVFLAESDKVPVIWSWAHGGIRYAIATETAKPDVGAETIDIKAPLAIARLFVDDRFRESGLLPLHFWQGQFYRYSGTAYGSSDVNVVRNAIYQFLDAGKTAAGDPIKPNRRMVDDIQDALRAVTHLDQPLAPAWISGQPPYPLGELIPCANGIVHVPTRTLIPATPALFNLNATEFAFDRNAPEPVAWREFLASLWDDDIDSIETLQEFFGLALTTDTRYQKALLIVGPKRSGKGTIARVLTELVGPANTAAPTLIGLGAQFGMQALIGRQLAIISDARLGGKADIHAITETLLRITGEDHIGVSRKFLSDFTARLPVRFVVMTNEVPALADSSGALSSRFIVLRLIESFYGREDLRLTGKLLAELPGLFLWALDGLERLRKRGGFVQPGSGQTMLDQLDELASPIKAFLRERCIIAAGASIDCARLFDEWRDWCRESNRDPGTTQTFGRNLGAAVPGLQITQPRIDGKRPRHYEGIRLRSVGDPE